MLFFWWGIVVFAVIFIGITKSGFGSGVGLMIVPMTAISLGHIQGHSSEQALGLLLPLLIAGDLIAVSQYRKLFFEKPATRAASFPVDFPGLKPALVGSEADGDGEIQKNGLETRSGAIGVDDPPPEVHVQGSQARAVIFKLLLGAAVGVVLGGLLLGWLHSRGNLVNALIRIEIGIESVLLVSLHWWRLYRGVQQHLMAEPWRSHLTGGFSAISSTLAHAAGPIIAMYLLPLRLDRQLYVGTCTVFFFLLNTAKLPAYYASGQFAHAQLPFTIRFLPLVLVGALFGRWLNKRLSDRLFTRIVYIVTFALGWYILADGLLRLFFNRSIA